MKQYILKCFSVNELLKSQYDDYKIYNLRIEEYKKQYGNINNLFFVGVKNTITDKNCLNTSESYIMDYFNIDFELYKQIVKKYNGQLDIILNPEINNEDVIKIMNDDSCYNFIFTSKEDCENVIKELEPLIVMGVLTKGGN